jgi:hypothetical protein
VGVRGPLGSRSASPLATNCSAEVTGTALLAQAGPGQKKKAAQKVQAPAQPFVALGPDFLGGHYNPDYK